MHQLNHNGVITLQYNFYVINHCYCHILIYYLLFQILNYGATRLTTRHVAMWLTQLFFTFEITNSPMPGAWCLVPNWWTGIPTVGADLLTLLVKLEGGGLIICRVNSLVDRNHWKCRTSNWYSMLVFGANINIEISEVELIYVEWIRCFCLSWSNDIEFLTSNKLPCFFYE